MFDYILNTRLSLVVNEVWVDEEPMSLIRMKNKQKTKALLNGTDLECLRCHEVKSKPWNTLNYWICDTVISMQSLGEFKAACETVHF